MSFHSFLTPRLDRINRLYDSCANILADSYKQYETIKKMRDEMLSMGEPKKEEAKAKYQDTLTRVLDSLTDSEETVKRCMRNLEDVTQLKAFLENLATVES